MIGSPPRHDLQHLGQALRHHRAVALERVGGADGAHTLYRTVAGTRRRTTVQALKDSTSAVVVVCVWRPWPTTPMERSTGSSREHLHQGEARPGAARHQVIFGRWAAGRTARPSSTTAGLGFPRSSNSSFSFHENSSRMVSTKQLSLAHTTRPGSRPMVHRHAATDPPTRRSTIWPTLSWTRAPARGPAAASASGGGKGRGVTRRTCRSACSSARSSSTTSSTKDRACRTTRRGGGAVEVRRSAPRRRGLVVLVGDIRRCWSGRGRRVVLAVGQGSDHLRPTSPPELHQAPTACRTRRSHHAPDRLDDHLEPMIWSPSTMTAHQPLVGEFDNQYTTSASTTLDGAT